MEFVTEPAKQVRVYANTDVLVVGGGIAGCTAAIAAANAGAKVILLERNGEALSIPRKAAALVKPVVDMEGIEEVDLSGEDARMADDAE